MPRAPLDQNTALQAIAFTLQQLSTYSVDELLKDHHLLEQQVKRLNMSWKQAAEVMGVSKSRLYHWFRETFSRKLRQQLTKEDFRKIKREVQQQMSTGEKPILSQIKSSLSQEYDSYVVKVAFQNAKIGCRIQNLPLLALPSFNVESDSKVNSARTILNNSQTDAQCEFSNSEVFYFQSFIME
ncbi:hypothetical protein SS50377_27403 [Spironucleus salmonicida]|uniref:Uncharacterized protein n=1 Tax=Spironucleus salmonicida TaxID=348837 RepID=V6LHX4_9EUKA|nr:hypothetical protein SS50377_27403 [Spironucleus salmonicida]|eukprot:EST43306.1 hypothetical protein SS50377_16974 [Spironucleus salmonicida]